MGPGETKRVRAKTIVCFFYSEFIVKALVFTISTGAVFFTSTSLTGLSYVSEITLFMTLKKIQHPVYDLCCLLQVDIGCGNSFVHIKLVEDSVSPLVLMK